MQAYFFEFDATAMFSHDSIKRDNLRAQVLQQEKGRSTAYMPYPPPIASQPITISTLAAWKKKDSPAACSRTVHIHPAIAQATTVPHGNPLNNGMESNKIDDE
jgi:hypothetical protein